MECSAKIKCWQHHGEHYQRMGASRQRIERLIACLKTRVERAGRFPSQDAFIRIQIAVRVIHELYNERWRFINFEPFNSIRETESTGPRGLSDLLADIGL